LQFDISSKDAVKTLASKQVIYSGPEKVGALQIDPVNYAIIFAAFQGSNILGKITGLKNLVSPTGNPAIMAKFTRNGFGLDASGKPITLPLGATSQLGLPPTIPFPITPQPPPSISQTCDGTTFKYTVSQKLCDPLNNDRIDWKIYQTTLSPFPQAKTGILVPLDDSKLIHSFTGAELKYDFATSDNYVITAAITNSCVKAYLLDAQQFDIVVLKPVTLDAEYNRICKTDAKITLTKTPVSKNLVYAWSNGDKTPTATFKYPGGNLSLALSDTATKCSVKVSTKVNFLENSYVMPKKDFSICMDSPVPFPIQLNSSTKDLKFEWTGSMITSADINNQILVKTSGNYQVKITDKEGCVLNNTFPVSDKCEPIIIAPSIFTPNGDGKNDYFSPLPKVAKRVEILTLQIFNRWGEMIFSKSGSPDLQWDGKSNGVRVPQDSYVWVIQYKAVDYPEKGTQTIRGAVIVAY
jgi:gliding motility-associated-like protein